MTTRRRLLLLLLFVLLSTIINNHQVAQGQSVTPSFSIKITTPHDTISPPDDVELDISLANESNRELVFSISGKRDPAYRIDVRNSEGKEPPLTKEYEALVHPKPLNFPVDNWHRYYVEPGKTATQIIVLNKMWDLKTPGKYTIQVRRRDDVNKVEVESNTITVTVTL